jgi:hypothetical protein
MKMNLVAFACVFLLRVATVKAFSRWPVAPAIRRSSVKTCLSSSISDNPALEALQSLSEFHEGTWRGNARSFTVTSDVVAGVVQRQESVAYNTSVQFSVDLESQDFTMVETLQWESNTDGNMCLSNRRLPFTASNLDVDAVDASYSLDCSLPQFLPKAISGTDKQAQFMIEHVIASSSLERVRCFLLYGVAHELIRVVVCQEEKIGLSALDLIEIQSDVDRLVERITGNGDTTMRSNSNQSQGAMSSQSEEQVDTLKQHMASLLEISSGVWFGDSVIRDVSGSFSTLSSKGFAPRQQSQKSVPSFATWELGVQKSAWRWMWNFGEEIRQVVDVGKSIGPDVNTALSTSCGGVVHVNEGLSRRLKPEARIVYIGWTDETVGFVTGSAFVHAPMYLDFDRNPKSQPFYSELMVFQREDKASQSSSPMDADDEIELPEVICSKLSRVYSAKGDFLQGVSSFYTLKRFGSEKDNL